MPAYSLEIKSVYDFTMKASSILGAGFKAATVLGLLDYQSAIAIEDVTPVHASVYSQLGTGVPKKASDLTYVKIKTSTGQVRVIAMDWIAGQPTLVTSTSARVTVGGINLSDIDRMRQVLLANGFTQIEIEVLNPPA